MGGDDLVELYKRIAADLQAQLDEEALEMEREVQSDDVQYLFDRVKYWKAKARFHLQQRFLKMNRSSILNERLKEYQQL
ncbi:hypothetical protein N7513_012936 [Penicillium frequentans]|nr:hypothetical protein N7513_012936 [Penicillium glabrum]